MNFLGNGYSPNMCVNPNVDIQQRELTKEDFRDETIGALSCIGHQDFAQKLTEELEREIPFNRRSIYIQPGNVFYYACVNGKRLKESTTRFPKDREVRYFRLKFKEAKPLKEAIL